MVALLLLFACAQEKAAPPPAPAKPDPVARAVELARAVKADPEHAAEALAAKGATEEELNALLLDIAADPAMSEAYTRGLESGEAEAAAAGSAPAGAATSGAGAGVAGGDGSVSENPEKSPEAGR